MFRITVKNTSIVVLSVLLMLGMTNFGQFNRVK